jgi:hypothetical protein
VFLWDKIKNSYFATSIMNRPWDKGIFGLPSPPEDDLSDYYRQRLHLTAEALFTDISGNSGNRAFSGGSSHSNL